MQTVQVLYEGATPSTRNGGGADSGQGGSLLTVTPSRLYQGILGKYSTAGLKPSPLFAYVCEIGSCSVIQAGLELVILSFRET